MWLGADPQQADIIYFLFRQITDSKSSKLCPESLIAISFIYVYNLTYACINKGSLSASLCTGN